MYKCINIYVGARAFYFLKVQEKISIEKLPQMQFALFVYTYNEL